MKVIIFVFFLFLNTFHSLYASNFLYKLWGEYSFHTSSLNSMFKQGGSNLWISTDKGVYRYDGYFFQLYSDLYSPDNFQSSMSYQVIEDKNGDLWHLSGKGLGLFRPKSDFFDYEVFKKKIQGPVYSACLLDDGVIFAGDGLIYFYDYKTKDICNFADIRKSISSNRIRFIFRLSSHQILLGVDDKIVRYHLKEDKWSTTTLPGLLSSLYVDSSEQIWAGVLHKGLIRLDHQGKMVQTFDMKNSSLTSNNILCFEEKGNSLWMGTDNGGINILNLSDMSITSLTHVSGEFSTLPSNSIRFLYNDNDQIMWAGTFTKGIIEIRESDISFYDEVSDDSTYGLSNSTVLSLFQDGSEDDIWIGTDGDGLNKMDLRTRSFTHYPSTKGCKVVSISHFDENTLLVSILLKGLYLFDKHTGSLTLFSIPQQEVDTAFLTNSTYTYVYRDRGRYILLSSGKMYTLDVQSHRLKEIFSVDSDDSSTLLFAGKYNGDLYFHDLHNIYHLNSHNNIVSIVHALPQKTLILTSYLDPSGNIWLNTNKGLSGYSLSEKQKINIHGENILDISNIIADSKGNLWIFTFLSAYVYMPGSNHIAILGSSDGVKPNIYIPNARLMTSQGDLVMGGTKGVLVVDRTYRMTNSDKPVVKLTKVILDEDELQAFGKKIDIPTDCKFLRIFVKGIESDFLRKKKFRYIIRGEINSVYESYSPFLTIHSFSYGESKFLVSCQKKDGAWTEPEHLLTINVLLPWYKTLLFEILLSLVVASLLIGLIILFYRRKNQKLRIQLKEKEKDMYEEKVQFLIHITHELRTPLTLIIAPLQHILQKNDHQSLDFSSLAKISRQANRMKSLLDMVLDLRKLEVGDKSLFIASYDFNSWLKGIVSDFNIDENPNGITIQTSLSPNIHLVNFDKKKCEIILSNLLINAINHSPKGGNIVVSSTLIDDRHLMVSVHDEGSGLSDSNLEKIFDSFYQGNNETFGSGIGLSYSKLLVELHNGTIGAKNNEGKGATFFFTLPLDLKEGKKLLSSRSYINEIFPAGNHWSKKVADYSVETYDTSSKVLLLVDDNKELTDFLRDEFLGKFKSVEVASNGVQALNCMKKMMPDLVVSDIMMPDMDGYELCAKIKTDIEYSHIPVILLTARNEVLSESLGYKLGADAFIPKPFDIDSLYELIVSRLKIRDDMKQKYTHLSVLPTPEASTFSQTDENFLIRLNELILKEIDNTSLDVTFICNELGMSKTSLYNKLKAVTGISCNEYINKIRLERAKELVRSTDKNFAEIADQVGFSNSRYFSTCFKQYTGKTPSQFRSDSCKETD